MTVAALHTREQLLAKMGELANSSNYNLSTRDQFNALKQLFDIANSSDAPVPTYNRWHERNDPGGIVETRRKAHEALRRDAAATEFFSSSAHNHDTVVSDYGSKLTKQACRVGGKSVGNVVALRSYAGLDTGTSGDAGGFTAPILFWQTVTATLKQIDELFLAAQWINTPTGGLFDLPLADDIGNVAAVVVESSGTVVDGPNPAFSQLQFPSAPLWSSGRIKASLQVANDSPVLEDYLARAFARRFARGMGAAFTTTLLSGIGTTTSSSASALVPDDLFGLIGSIDEEYARRGAWLMKYSTWVAIRKLTTSNHYFVGSTAQVDANMRPYLLERPVYFSPTMDAIGAGAKPIVFGDLSRFIVRSVGAEQTIYKFVEAFMPSHQIAWEAIWRADGALLKASGTDAPILALRQPLS